MNIGLDLRFLIEGLVGDPVKRGEKELLQQDFSKKPEPTYLIENIVNPIWLKN